MSRKKSIIIFGTGQIAELAYFYFTHDTHYKVKGFTVDDDFVESPTFMGLPVIPFSQVDKVFPASRYDAFVALSYNRQNATREEKYLAMKSKGYEFTSYISSKATVWPGLQVGENCFILEDNTIQPYVEIADNVTLWSGNHIGHHSKVGAHAFVTSQVVISGGVEIGRNAFIGVNATVRDHIFIAPYSVIGAGACILESTEEGAVYKCEQTLGTRQNNRYRGKEA